MESRVSVPLAPKLRFPALEEEGVAFMFTDAARGQGTGHGAFTLVRAGSWLVFIYIDPRWPEEVLLALQENEVSMPAGEGIGAVVGADALAEMLPGLRFLYVFTDSTAVVAATQSSNSSSPQMNAVVRWLFDRRPQLQLVALHQPGVRNGVADALSRAGTDRVLAEARAAGAITLRIDCDAATRAVSEIALAVPQVAD